MYSDVYMTLFNVVFTALTPIVIGIFDRDVDRDKGLQYPALYKQGESRRQRTTYEPRTMQEHKSVGHAPRCLSS